MGQRGTPGRQQSLPKTFHQSWRHTDNCMTASSGRPGRDVLLCVSVPVLEGLVTRDCSQVRPMLGGLFSPIVCSIRASVFSPGTLDLGTGKGYEFCASSKEEAGNGMSLHSSRSSRFSILES